MANYGVTWSNGGSVTQNVTTADTITVATGSTGGWFVSNTTNCSASPSSGSATTSCVISFSATGSYSCTIVNSSFTASWTISGTVSSGVQDPANPLSGNYTINWDATADLTVNISGGASGEAYSLCDASGLDYATKGTNLYVVANRRNISNNTTAVTISNYNSYTENSTCTTFISSYSSGAGFTIDNYSLPTLGNTKTFYIYRYRYTSQSPAGAGQYFTGDTFTVTRPYVAPANPTVSNQTIASNFSGDLSVSLSGGDTGDAYSLCVTSGLTTNSQVVADRIDAITPYDNTDFVIPAANLPTAGNSKTYYIYRYRYATSGGAQLYYQGNSFTITRSAAAVPTYSVTAPTSINEGASGTINVSTTDVANGTTLYWTVAPTADFGTTSGSFTINSNAGSFTVTPSADLTTEGAETATISIRTTSTSGTVVATDTFTINDTSPEPSASATVTVRYDSELGQIIVTNGGSTSNRITLAASQVLAITTSPLHDGSTLTINGFSTNVWTNSSSINISSGTETKLVKASPTLGNVDLTVTKSGATTKYIYLTIVSSIDDTPDAFNLPDITAANPNSKYLIKYFTVSGINTSVTMSCSGTANPTTKVGVNGTEDSSNKTVQNGDGVYIYGNAPSTYAATSTASLTIGTRTESADITTKNDPASGTRIPLGISSGAINMDALRKLFGVSSYGFYDSVGLSQLYRGGSYVPDITTGTPNNANIPTSGEIALSDFYDSCTVIYFSTDPSNKSALINTISSAQTVYLTFSTDDWTMGYSPDMKYAVEYAFSHDLTLNAANAGSVTLEGSANNGSYVNLITNDPYSFTNYSDVGTLTLKIVAAQSSECIMHGQITITARHKDKTSYSTTTTVEYTINVYGP